ncbi:type II toxin-antitoxin system RelE/ParE family toxin [Alishewanella sp. d11]|uniref:type II toxin-antitoxin system RelE/ParE family toxin n=1 Tax=Alishewanella sp. d11 TaxID=3414030 RepID=UPI003BF8B3B0
MQVYKSKWFGKWADKEDLTDQDLSAAVKEMVNGLIDADLGGHVMKKRVALQGQGKSGGARTLLAFKLDDKAFFMYGFTKNQQDNISAKELKALKAMAKQVLGYTPAQLKVVLNAGEFIEVRHDE